MKKIAFITKKHLLKHISKFVFFVLALTFSGKGCDGGNLPSGLAPARGDGPVVRFDLYAKPLPAVPLPSDLAARPDPNSPTGLRLNASQHAPTELESNVRELLDTLDGWGTYSPITSSFDCPGDRDGICLDLDTIVRLHQEDGYDFTNDAIYVINIQKFIDDPETGKKVPNPYFGKPVPLDIGGGNIPMYLDRTGHYYPYDPRWNSPTILFESVNEVRGEDVDCDGKLDSDEDINGNGKMDPGEDVDGDGWLDINEDKDEDGELDRPKPLDEPGQCENPTFYEPEFDTNFDGIMGRANVWCSADSYRQGKCHCIGGHECPRNLDPSKPEDMERLYWLLDPNWHTITFYEIATNTLIIRPLIPLQEMSKYAVVFTRRLVGEGRKEVRSPFEYINHVEQTSDLEVLPEILSSEETSKYYGGLKLQDIQFAWSFTTQSVTKDLQEIRRGLYGYGKFKRLSEDFPPELYVNRAWACDPRSLGCKDEEVFTEEQRMKPYVIKSEDFLKLIMRYAKDLFGLSEQEAAAVTDSYKYVDYFVFGHFWSPNFLDNNGDGVEAYRGMSEDRDGDGKLEYTEDLNCNGVLDPGEDSDGDTVLDTTEDQNLNNILDPGEDKDGDGHLDKYEDLNQNCKLDVVKEDEGYWKVNHKTGEGKYSRGLVPFIIAVPKKEFKIKGKENEPFPVVFYGHGYTSMLVESLGFAGSLAQFGLATVGIDCVHHGLGEGDIDKRTLSGLFNDENLAGLIHGFLDDRVVDMNGDGKMESAGDFWTAYLFHTRDVVRQSALDHYAMIRILRSFDGVRKAGPVDVDGDGVADDHFDFVAWSKDPASRYYDLVGDYNRDGQVDLAGDFNGDGEVDVGGPANSYFAWGQSLGGIMSALMGGAEPAIKAIAPTSGGGGLGDIAIRSTQGGVKEAVILRTIGPIITANRVSNGKIDDGDTICRDGDLSLDFTVPDLNDTANVEFACACFGETSCPEDNPAYFDHYTMDDSYQPKPIHFNAGDGVVLYNVTKNKRHCAIVGKSGELRISYPSDLLDVVELEVYDGKAGLPFKDFEECEPASSNLLKAHIKTWRRNKKFQFWEWNMVRRPGDPEEFAPVGETLRSPAEGYGIIKNTPDFRRFLLIGQIVLEPGDPINYAPHYFEDPLYYPEEEQYYPRESRRTNALVIGTIGDMNVPVNTAGAQGRAAGIFDMYNKNTPYGKSINQVYLDNYVIEANERYGRTYPDDASGRCTPETAPGGCNILFDVDDIDRDCDGLGSPYIYQPVRAWIASNPSERGDCSRVGIDPETGFDKWKCGECEVFTSTVSSPPANPTRNDSCRSGEFLERVTCPGGVSMMLWPYLETTGKHGFDVPKPCNAFDIDMFMINVIGLYFSTDGKTLSLEMCNQWQPREDAMDPSGSKYLFCPTWKQWTCPACPNRRCSRQWYDANHPPNCPDNWEDIPENEHELLPSFYTTACANQ